LLVLECEGFLQHGSQDESVDKALLYYLMEACHLLILFHEGQSDDPKLKKLVERAETSFHQTIQDASSCMPVLKFLPKHYFNQIEEEKKLDEDQGNQSFAWGPPADQ
jgi:hypothetical protein